MFHKYLSSSRMPIKLSGLCASEQFLIDYSLPTFSAPLLSQFLSCAMCKSRQIVALYRLFTRAVEKGSIRCRLCSHIKYSVPQSPTLNDQSFLLISSIKKYSCYDNKLTETSHVIFVNFVKKQFIFLSYHRLRNL